MKGYEIKLFFDCERSRGYFCFVFLCNGKNEKSFLRNLRFFVVFFWFILFFFVFILVFDK